MIIKYDYSGYRVLVTGGTSGIGLSAARMYHEAGADVTITGTKSPENYDVDLSKTELFTTSVLNDKTLLKEHSLINAKFPFISETNINEFNKLWKLVWSKSETDHLMRLGYYISKISIWVASQNTKFENQLENGRNKFSILGNKFIFKDNGNVLRPVNIYKINKSGMIKKINSCL